MTDILERLKHWASIQADGSQLGADLREAIVEIERHKDAAVAKTDEVATLQQALSEKDEEIERLTAAAGAVSAGQSFADIKDDIATSKGSAS